MSDRPLSTDSGDPAERAAALYQQACDLIVDNKVVDAVGVINQCRALDPSHYHAARTLAAIAMTNGYDADGRAILTAYYDAYPCRTALAERIGKDPALVLLRGFSDSHVIPWRDAEGRPTTRFRGGHFTVQYLLTNPTYPIHRFTIVRDNILRPGMLPKHGLMLNTIADPDLERASLETLATYLDRTPDAKVINRPDKVLETTRDANWRRLQRVEGLVFPETHRVRFEHSRASEVAAVIRERKLDDGPMILRATGTHTARSTALIRSGADLDRYMGDGTLSGDHYLIRYIETRFRGDFFRKLRLFWIGGVFYPVVCHIDRHWNVHGGNRKEVMRGDESLIAEEKRFLADWRAYVGARNADLLERIAADAGLEFLGVDFTVDDAGRVLIYEMNPAMRHAFDHGKAFPYKLPYDFEISQAFTDMVDARLRG